jgi:predicted O-methyltransferase YrrM
VTSLEEGALAVLARLEREDADERERGVPAADRARQVARTTGQFLHALAAPHREAAVLEIGGSRGYSTIWLAAGARIGGGRVVSLEHDPRKLEARHRNL